MCTVAMILNGRSSGNSLKEVKRKFHFFPAGAKNHLRLFFRKVNAELFRNIINVIDAFGFSDLLDCILDPVPGNPGHNVFETADVLIGKLFY